MNDADPDLVRRRLLRSVGTLQEADDLIARSLFHGAINRLYYAAFYAARGLLAAKGLESSKHSHAISLFQQHFVKTNIVPVDVARVLQDSFDERQLVDYGDFVDPVRDEVLDLRNAVERFVTFCSKWIETQLPS